MRSIIVLETSVILVGVDIKGISEYIEFWHKTYFVEPGTELNYGSSERGHRRHH